MSTTNFTRLHGNEAIEFAQENGLTLSKYNDAISGPATDLSVDEAREIAREDSGLIYIDVNA